MNLANKKRMLPPGRFAGFSLLEMLVVVVVIGILLVLTVPAVSSIIRSTRITAAGDQLMSLLSAAQQIASVEGRPVEVRFVKHQALGSLHNANYQTVMILRNYRTGEMSPVGGKILTQDISVLAAEPFTLPSGVVISSNLALGASSIFTTTNEFDPNTATKPALMMYQGGSLQVVNSSNFSYTPIKYCSFIIRAEGTSLPLTDGTNALQWFFTVMDENDEETAGAFASVHNFYTIEIDPINGHASAYRP